MAKTSQIVRQQRGSKYKTRNYNRCRRCGRARAYYRKFGLCRICLREIAHEGMIPGHDEVVLVAEPGPRSTDMDTVADFLTRIRNAVHADYDEVVIPSSRFKRELARVLQGGGLHRGLLASSRTARSGAGAHDREPSSTCCT